MYGPVVWKVLIGMMLVLGLGTFFGMQYVTSQEPPTAKELLSIAVFIFGLGVAWATVKTDMKAIRKEFEDANMLLRTEVVLKFRLVQGKYEALSSRVSNLEHRKRGED
jgi:hypothetical protein